MKSIIASALALALTWAAHAETPAAAPSWMAGAWELDAEGVWGDEFWTPVRGGIMIGSARLGKDEKLFSFESMRIGFDEAGKLAFWAFPQWAKSPSKFPMVKQSDTEITFENAEHDYPQRVRYWRDGKLLKAEISLIDGSKAMAFSFKPMGGKE